MYKIKKNAGNGIIMNIRDTSIPLSYNSARALAAALRKVVEHRRLNESVINEYDELNNVRDAAQWVKEGTIKYKKSR